MLTMLDLSSNLLDDDKLRLLVTGLLDNDTLTHIDLSHNKVGARPRSHPTRRSGALACFLSSGHDMAPRSAPPPSPSHRMLRQVADRGARALARLLGEASVLTSVNLCDNEVHGEGGKALGRVLARNKSLLSLNLRLNRLGDDGGRLLAEGLRANRALRELNVAGNAFGVEAARSMGAVLTENRSLTWMDMSCNNVGEDGARMLRDGLENNGSLTALDLRMNNVCTALESAIAEALKSAEVRRQAVGYGS